MNRISVSDFNELVVRSMLASSFGKGLNKALYIATRVSVRSSWFVVGNFKEEKVYVCLPDAIKAYNSIHDKAGETDGSI
jgi:hypothetical protein